jgi:chemotaxis protein MotB
MAKKKKKGGGGGGGHETAGIMRWLLTYADMLTLLFGLFVLLTSVAMTSTAKYSELAAAFTHVFSIFKGAGKPLEGKGGALPGGSGLMAGEAVPAQLIKEKLAHGFSSEKQRGRMELVPTKNAVIIRLKDTLFFDVASASINPENYRLLDKIGSFLESIPNEVSIEGHTDANPIRGGRYATNWELSSARAMSILHYLLAHARRNPKIDFDTYKKRLSAVAYGDTRPAFPSSPISPQNRRVDIVIHFSKR